jgi:hypothetical protein
VSRQLALYGEHVAYRYRFTSTEGLPPLLAASMNRQGARAGLTWWLPVIR